MAGGQISLEVGLAAALLATVLGTLWGAVAGYFGGITDSVMMRIVDALLAIPTLFLALVVVSIWPPTETELILVIALTSWLTTSRLIRGEALSLRVRDYVQAMRVMGGGVGAGGVPAHRAERDRHDHRQRDLPGRRRDPAHRRAVLPRPGHPAAADGLGRHAQRRPQRRLRRVLVADLPGRHRDHPRRHRHQLHRRRAPRRVRGPAAAAFIFLVGGRFSVGSASVDRRPAHRDPAAPRGRARHRRRVADGQPRRVPRHRRRVRQRQDDDRAVDHAAAARRRLGRRRHASPSTGWTSPPCRSPAWRTCAAT